MDRVIHTSHRIKLTGESMRKALANMQHGELTNG
jgi:hypothetical protein